MEFVKFEAKKLEDSLTFNNKVFANKKDEFLKSEAFWLNVENAHLKSNKDKLKQINELKKMIELFEKYQDEEEKKQQEDSSRNKSLRCRLFGKYDN